MANVDFGATEHKLAQFAEALGAHAGRTAVATPGPDLASRLAEANELFDVVSDVDTRWHGEVHVGARSYDEAEWDRLGELYRCWGEVGRELLLILEAHPELPVDPDGLARLRANLNEVRGILTPDAEFFDDPRLVARQEEALEAYRRGETVKFEEMGD